jgi:hypothetical protein
MITKEAMRCRHLRRHGHPFVPTPDEGLGEPKRKFDDTFSAQTLILDELAPTPSYASERVFDGTRPVSAARKRQMQIAREIMMKDRPFLGSLSQKQGEK